MKLALLALFGCFTLISAPHRLIAAPVTGGGSCTCKCGDGSGNTCQAKGTGAAVSCTSTGLPLCLGGGCGCYNNNFGVLNGLLGNGPSCSKGEPAGVTHVPAGPGEVDQVSCTSDSGPVTVVTRIVPNP